MTMPFAALGGIVVHHRFVPASGERTPVVFINSLGTDFRIWDAVVDDFADRPTLVYDKRGHGLSSVGRAPYSIDDHVDDLCALIDHLKLDKVVLCGLSVGGLIALGLLARRPDAVEKLVLCDTAHKIGTTESWNQRIAEVEAGGIEAIADLVMQRWFTPLFHAERSPELAGYRAMLARQPAAGYAATCAAIRDADFTQTARALTLPTLCIVGDQDGATPPDLVRSTADLIPGARFEVIEGAGHIPCVEKPAALVALLRGFIDSPIGG